MLLFSKLLSANLAIHKVSRFQILDEDEGLLAGSEALLHQLILPCVPTIPSMRWPPIWW